MKISRAVAEQLLDVEAAAILSLKDRLGSSFDRAAELILACRGKLVTTGIGKSGIVARKIASTFSSTGTPSVYLHPSESSHGDLGLLASGDVVLAISYGGETPELASILSFVARKGIPLIVISGNSESEMARKSSAFLDVKVRREACPLGLAPTASSTATLAMGDALAMVVSEARGFRTEDFAELHPGGGLGFKLSRIRELMHTGSRLPVLPEEATMKQVVSAMSAGEVRGAVCIVDSRGDLAGIITDGDIRRLLDSAERPLEGLARERMTRGPKTVDANEIAERALFLMEQFRIQLLFVLDSSSSTPKRPVGLIHIQDLLRAKVR